MKTARATTSCGSGRLDLAPPDHCLARIEIDRGLGYPKHVDSIAFDELISAATRPEHLFTCQRTHLGEALTAESHPTPKGTYLSRYRHTSTAEPPAAQAAGALFLSDVSVGMPVKAAWVVGTTPRAGSPPDASMTDAAALAELCAAGEALACARSTWMAQAPTLDVLLLADCLELKTRVGAPERRAVFHEHSRFPAPVAWWLRPNKGFARLDVRCYWSPYSGLGSSHRKTAVLFRAMLERLGLKRYYLKVDADAILRPRNLLHLLRFFQAEVRLDAPIYFGNHWGASNCTGSLQNRGCRNIRFLVDECSGGICNTSLVKGGRLRSTPAWRSLEKHIRSSGGWRIDSGAHSVTYASGGVYGMSRVAAQRLTNTSCLARLGALRCEGCAHALSGIAAHTHEDAAMGLCMHLMGAKMVQCHAFHLFSPTTTGNRGWLINSRPLQTRLHAAWRGAQEAPTTAQPREMREHQEPAGHSAEAAGAQNRSRLLAAVKALFRDQVPPGQEKAYPSAPSYLSKHPIALHPVKQLSAYHPLWMALELRDEDHEGSLQTWRARQGAAHSSDMPLRTPGLRGAQSPGHGQTEP